MEEKQNVGSVLETVGSVCWFLMDACWMLGLATMAQVMAVPTLLLSLVLFRFTARNLPDMMITATIAFWASMNVCWMLSDLGVWLGTGLVVAKVFFGLGSVCLFVALLSARTSKEAMYALLARFRRLRIQRKD